MKDEFKTKGQSGKGAKWLILITLLFLAGCATQPAPLPPFEYQDYQYSSTAKK